MQTNKNSINGLTFEPKYLDLQIVFEYFFGIESTSKIDLKLKKKGRDPCIIKYLFFLSIMIGI